MYALILFAALSGQNAKETTIAEAKGPFVLGNKPFTVTLQTPEPPLSYALAKATAERERKRLVVYVEANNLRHIPGCVHARLNGAAAAKLFPGLNATGGAIVVGVPDGLPGLARYDLGPNATESEILTVGQLRLLAPAYQPAYYPAFFGSSCGPRGCR